MDSKQLERLRLFLNKECMWIPNEKTGTFCKIYHCTTSISPYFNPDALRGRHQDYKHFMNVTIIILKPKKQNAYITAYINGKLIACFHSEAVFVKRVTGTPLTLIYFGRCFNAKNVNIPAEIECKVKENERLTVLDILQTSTPIHDMNEFIDVKNKDINPIGKCGAWMFNNIVYSFFIKMDMMVCCPSIPAFPSLSQIITFMTKCENKLCVSCYGRHIHVELYAGYTASENDGHSGRCPCLMPCSALENEYIPIRRHRNLLGLMFKPEDQKNVVGFKILSNSITYDIRKLLCGVTATGDEIECSSDVWQLLKLSTFFSRVLTDECQILKSLNLHSY